jgi:hypothetical protein
VAGVGLADLDHRQHVGQRVHARPAVLFRHFDAHKAQLTHLADGLEGELARLVVFGGDGGDGVAAEVARRLCDHAVFVGDEG